MATVTYDSRSFLVDGRRIWLVSGAVHYFRTPAALWRDRLLKARRGGLNCIETYIAWNFHEPVEGKWDFSGDRDVVEFIRQAGDLGMYVIVRPGPYICAEWEFGGFPAWLATKSGMQYRTNNATYTHYFDKYFRQILPRLTDLQVTRGGNVIAIQNENEYFMTTMPDRAEHLNFITTLYRRAGIDVPILTCNWLTEPLTDGAIECNNCWDSGVVNLKRLRAMQPDKPLLTTEYWPGGFDWWGAEHHTRDDRECARRALELTGGGSQVNYYMFHGGTHFGFWGGRNVMNDHCFMTTSYDYDAPVAEGGGLSRKYYLLRLVNVMCSSLTDVLAAALPVEGPATLTGTSVSSLAGASGRLTVVTNNGDDDIRNVRVALHNGQTLDVDLSHFGAVAILSDAQLTDKLRVDYCNLMPLGFFAQRLLVLHGQPGQPAVLSVNGQPKRFEVANEPRTMEHQGLTVLVLTSQQAERCWVADGRLIVGPAFVGETPSEVTPAAGTRQYLNIALDDGLAVKKQRMPSMRRKPQAPKLGVFKRVSVSAEPGDDGQLAWRKMDRPRDLTALGAGLGYGWYRVSINSPRKVRRKIFFPAADDRITIWLNGKRAGVWGHGPDATRSPMPLELNRGENVLAMLADNLGRFCFGFAMGEPKGIWDNIFAASPIRPKPWKVRDGAEKDCSRRLIPRNQLCLFDKMEQLPLKVCDTSFTLTRPMSVHFRYSGIGHHVAVLCNDRPSGFFAGHNGGWGEAVLHNGVKRGVNRIRLLVWGDVSVKQVADAVSLHVLEDNLTAGQKWRFRPWTLPNSGSGTPHRGLPAWYSCKFRGPSADGVPLFVKITGAKKGQLYLNGHNLGRFWTIGPQTGYYLPSCWLGTDNELLIFEESGRAPTAGTKLEFRPGGPYE